MRAEDVAGLSAEQIARKFSLPQVPDRIVDVTLPSGIKMQASVANGILEGAKGGGGGVQFEIQMPTRSLDQAWFGTARTLK